MNAVTSRIKFWCFAAAATPLLTFSGGCGGGQVSEERPPGELAFQRSCQSCHTLPKATMKTDAEWPAIVERYGARAGLDEDTRQIIVAYLIASN